MKKKVTAVVPVRKRSQRVIGKNTRPFGDTTLLDLKLQVLKHVNGFDEIVVNTDCDTSKEIAGKHGVHVHERDEYFASSAVTNDVHWRHIAEVTETDVLVMAQTTSPMIKVGTFEAALSDYMKADGRCGSVNSVTAEKKFLWRDGMPINYDVDKTPKSQDLPDIVSLNFAITIISRDEMFKRCNVIGGNPKFIELDKVQSIDVDDELDFEFARFAYERYGLKWLLN